MIALHVAADRLDVPAEFAVSGIYNSPALLSPSERNTLLAAITRGSQDIGEAARRHGIGRETLNRWIDEFAQTAQSSGVWAKSEPTRTAPPTSAASNAGFRGRLCDVPVHELLWLLHRQQRSGLVTFHGSTRTHWVWLVDGRITAAQTEQQQGEAALFRVFDLAQGTFSVDFGEHEPSGKPLATDTQKLLNQAIWRSEESERLLGELPSVDEKLIPSPELQPSSLMGMQRTLLRAFAGGRSILQVHASGELGRLETLITVRELLARGHLLRTEIDSHEHESAGSLPLVDLTHNPDPGGPIGVPSHAGSSPALPADSLADSLADALEPPLRTTRRRSWPWLLISGSCLVLLATAALAIDHLRRAGSVAASSTQAANTDDVIASAGVVPTAGAEPRDDMAGSHVPDSAVPAVETPQRNPAEASVTPDVVATSSVASARPPCPQRMRLLDGSTFQRGSNGRNQRYKSARPRHESRVDEFCLDTHETTVAAYRECERASVCKPAPIEAYWPRGDRPKGTWRRLLGFASEMCNAAYPDRGDHPLNCVSWEQAHAYCRWRQARLPREAEWEYAARGVTGRYYPWGTDAPTPEFLNACGPECLRWRAKKGMASVTPLFDKSDRWPYTAPVGTFPAGATPSGILDLAGNVAEWTDDRLAPYPGAPSSIAEGPSDTRVSKGGSFGDHARQMVHAAVRQPLHISTRSHELGFRCASDPRH